jgi:hypothetical protein
MAVFSVLSDRRREKKRRKLMLAGAVWMLMKRKPHKSHRTIWVKEWLLKRNDLGAYETLLSELREEDQGSFLNFFRLSPGMFEWLLDQVQPYIQKQDTNYRQAISPGMRLAITLRYLATGEHKYFFMNMLHMNNNYFEVKFQENISNKFPVHLIISNCKFKSHDMFVTLFASCSYNFLIISLNNFYHCGFIFKNIVFFFQETASSHFHTCLGWLTTL